MALVAFINFFIGVLYRPASLYHPQRRAILHLKSLQKKSRHREAAQGLYNGNINANINGKNGQNFNNNVNNNINSLNNNSNQLNNVNSTTTNGQTGLTSGLGPSSSSVSGHHKPPYFDFSILKSKTIRILLSGTCISAFGLWTPIFLLVSILIKKLQFSSFIS